MRDKLLDTLAKLGSKTTTHGVASPQLKGVWQCRGGAISNIQTLGHYLNLWILKFLECF